MGVTTKEWFSRGRRLDAHIDSLLRTRQKLRDDLTSTTARYTGDVVDGTRDPHKFDALVDLEDMIDREVDRLYAVKQEILAVALRVEDKASCDLLIKRYVDCKKWEHIAVEMNYDYFYVKGALHGKALKAAEPLVKEYNGAED